jgi:hypothetical protein
MPVVGNRIKVASSSTGTGNITLGSAEDGYQTFAAGGISNNDVVRYVITEGSAWEIGKGTYLTSGPTLVRTSGNLLESSTGSLLNLGGSATVFVSLADVDVMQTDGGTFTGAVTFNADTNLNGITAGNQAIYRGNGALKLTGGGPQNSRNLVNLSNSAGATIYGGSASTNATLRSTYGVTIDGGDGDVTLASDVTFTGASYDAVWVKSTNVLRINTNAQFWLGSGGSVSTRFYHDGSNSYENNYTGSIFITNYANDQDIVIATDDGSGGTANYFIADGSTGEVQLYHYGSQKLATKSTGIDVVSGDIRFGGSADEKIASVSSRVYLNGALGSQLRAGNNTKVAATTTGVELTGTTAVTGNITVTGTVDGVDIATNIPSSLGTAGQVLTLNAGATAGEWADVSASANDDIFWENGQTVSSNYTITNGKNAMSAGPITIASGVTVTVGSGETWTVV